MEITEKIYAMAMGIGFLTFGGWMFLWLLVWIGQSCWAWVDDTEVAERNKLVILLNKLWGNTLHRRAASGGGYYLNKNDDSVEGGSAFFKTVFITALIPIIIVAIVDFYTVALIALSAYALAHVTRFARRHKKLFDKHVDDKNAHK
jgi:hypothetical protein